MSTSKDPVLNSDKQLYENVVVGKINKLNVLDTGSKDVMNAVVYMIAFALGVKEGVRTPSNTVHGWVRVSGFNASNTAYMSYIYSVALGELRKKNKENMITDGDVVLEIAAEYSNTGLKIIDDMIPDMDNYDAEAFLLEIMAMLDDEFADIFPELVEE